MATNEISAEFPFASKYVEVHGSNMHYIDIGKGIHFAQEDNPSMIGEELAKWYKSI